MMPRAAKSTAALDHARPRDAETAEDYVVLGEQLAEVSRTALELKPSNGSG